MEPLAEVWQCDTDDGTFRLYWWTVEARPGDLHLNPDEASEARWVGADEFGRLEPTFDRHREFFSKVLPTLA